MARLAILYRRLFVNYCDVEPCGVYKLVTIDDRVLLSCLHLSLASKNLASIHSGWQGSKILSFSLHTSIALQLYRHEPSTRQEIGVISK